MAESDSGCPFWRKVGFASCALGFGVPGLFFLDVITAGVILGVLAAGLSWMAPSVLIHYLLWGRWWSAAELVERRRAADE